MAKAGRTGVELDDVVAAMAALETEGIRPTIRAVRDRLGRGSLGTIQRHMAALQGGDEERSGSPIVIPDRVAAALASWVTEEVALGTSVLRAELEAARETVRLLVAENESVTTTRDDGLEREADLLSQVDAAKSQLEAAEQACRGVRAELCAAIAAERSASEKLVRAEVRLEQLKGVQDEAKQLRGRAAEVDAACAQLRSLLASAEGQLQVFEVRLRGQTLRADESREDNAAKTAALDVERQRREVAEAEVMRITRLLERLIATVPEKHVGAEGKEQAGQRSD